MGVFRDVERLLRRLLRGLAPGPVDARILAPVHVGDAPVALIVGRARRVARADGFRGGGEVLARPGLVAIAPYDDRRMVLVALDHRHVAVDRRLRPFGPVRKRALAVTVAVRLDVRLVHEVDAVDVAEIVPVVRLRIVGVAHAVAVRVLEFAHVEFMRLGRDIVAEHGMCLVAVRALELYLLSIEIVAAVLYLAHTETEEGRDEFTPVSEHDLVAVGRFGAPQPRLLDHERLVGAAEHKLVVKRVQRNRHFAVTLYIDAPVAAEIPFLDGGGRHEEVAYAVLGPAQEPRAAEDSRETEHVLVLEIAAVGVAVDFKRDSVAPRLDEPRDIELGRGAAVLRKADVFTVDPQIEEAVDTVELEERAVGLPSFGEIEVAAVASYRIARGVVCKVLRRLAHDIRAARPVGSERIADVGVEGRSPAALPVGAHRLPRTGNLYDGPRRHVIARLPEIGRPRRRVFRPVEAPRRVGIQRHLPVGEPRQYSERALERRERRKRRAGPLLAIGKSLVVLPLAAVGPRRKNGAGRHEDRKGDCCFHGAYYTIYGPCLHKPHGSRSAARISRFMAISGHVNGSVCFVQLMHPV